MIPLSRNAVTYLHAIACKAIAKSHCDAINEITARKVGSTQREAVFVAHLCGSMADVARGWGGALAATAPGLRLSMASVFTHQTPRVTWISGATRKTCELADVLLAIIDRSAGPAARGVAVLIQAKQSSSDRITLSNISEKKQFELLATRPSFDVDAASAPTSINLGPYSPDKALMYGLTSPNAACIPSNYQGSHEWLTAADLHSAAGTYSVAGTDCLAYMLTGMLLGNFGWTFDLPPKGGSWRAMAAASPRDDWAVLVNYLLEQTFAKPMAAAHGAFRGRPFRGQEDLLYLIATDAQGKRQFFLDYEMVGSATANWLSQNGDGDENTWRQGNLGDEVALTGGGSADGGEQSSSDDPPPGGSISAILFEINRKG